MAINFDLNDLQAFRAVVEKGNFGKAAEAIHISQPALSRRIEKLEDAFPACDRSWVPGPEMTAQGRT
jgi:hypothetical protein